MVSSYTTNKNLEKPGNGDYVDTWNVPVNGDMNIIDAALGGVTSLNATGGSATLTDTQYQKLILNITGAISADVTYTIPSGVGGSWIVRNSTTDASGGPWSIIINSGGGGTSVTCFRGKAINIYCDGTNVRDISENATIGTVTSVDVSGGTTGLTTSGGPITTSGTITLAGTLGIANGGTGLTALGTNVATALATNASGSGAFVLASGATSSGRLNPRVSSAASATSITPDLASYDQYCLTALATGLTVNAPIGTPLDGNKLIFRLLDNGSSQAITWDSTYTPINVVLPTVTNPNKTVYVGCIYNADKTRWDVVAAASQA